MASSPYDLNINSLTYSHILTDLKLMAFLFSLKIPALESENILLKEANEKLEISFSDLEKEHKVLVLNLTLCMLAFAVVC